MGRLRGWSASRGRRCSRRTGNGFPLYYSGGGISPPAAVRACAPSRTSWSSPRLWMGSVLGSSARPSWSSCTEAACPATANDDMPRAEKRAACRPALSASAMLSPALGLGADGPCANLLLRPSGRGIKKPTLPPGYCVRLAVPLGDEPPLITLRVVPPAARCAVVRGVLPGVLTPPLTPPARGAAAPPSWPPSSAASSSSRPSWPSCEGVRRRVSAWLTLD